MKMIELLCSESERDQLEGTQNCRRLLARDPNPSIEEDKQRGNFGCAAFRQSIAYDENN